MQVLNDFMKFGIVSLSMMHAILIAILINPWALRADADKIEPKFVHRMRVFPDSSTIFAHAARIENYTLYFVTCKTPNQKVSDCNLWIEKSINGPAEYTQMCEFQLQSHSENFEMAEYLNVFRFGLDSFLVIWIDHRQKFELRAAASTLPWLNSEVVANFVIIKTEYCATFETKITRMMLMPGDFESSLLTDYLKIYLYEDKFDVVYKNSASSESLVMESFNNLGRQIFSQLHDGHVRIEDDAVVMASYSNMRQNVIQSQERFNIQKFCMGNHFCDFSKLDNENLKGISTANKFSRYCEIGVSSSNTTEFNCKRTRGITWKFLVRFSYIPQIFMIYNMPTGSILTVTAQESSSKNDSHIFFLTKYDEPDIIHKSVQFGACKYQPQTLLGHFFVDEHARDYKNVCFSLLCVNELFYENIIRCYTMEELSTIIS
ncbi:hypothetical protein QAD02_012048 [Eretmocerus hayati]|uniref:Uncharacterized protein n=1 Tax=Eretmocerus hayati TaxID=131215 RepID=A0ACC2NYQ8_9HYME|nr:hypothetical protein QAD02_012048 [Eretmocerus hayati]